MKTYIEMVWDHFPVDLGFKPSLIFTNNSWWLLYSNYRHSDVTFCSNSIMTLSYIIVSSWNHSKFTPLQEVEDNLPRAVSYKNSAWSLFGVYWGLGWLRCRRRKKDNDARRTDLMLFFLGLIKNICSERAWSYQVRVSFNVCHCVQSPFFPEPHACLGVAPINLLDCVRAETPILTAIVLILGY